jgi:glutaredoxin-like protein NrdH
MMLPPATAATSGTEPRARSRLERLMIMRELIVGTTEPPTTSRWRRRAACATDDPALVEDYTGDERNLPADRVEELREICRACHVAAECLLDDEAMTRGDPWSLRAGFTAAERKTIRRARRATARKQRTAERERAASEPIPQKATRRRPPNRPRRGRSMTRTDHNELEHTMTSQATQVEILALRRCVQCDATTRAMDRKGIPYTVTYMDGDPAARERAQALGYLQAPVVIAGDVHWSGFRPDEISKLAARVGADPDAPAEVR